MPLTRIDLRQGKSPAFKQALMMEIYQAMRDVFDVPENDRFMVLNEHGADTIVVSPDYLGVQRSDDAIIIQFTVSNTRSVETKRALYRRLVERLGRAAGVRPEDVFVNIVEVAKENWSFGNGIAHYA